MYCHGFHYHGNTISLHLEIFFLLIAPLYRTLHLSLFPLLQLLFTYKRGFLWKNMVSSFVFVCRFRGLQIQLVSLDTDINWIGTCNNKYVWSKDISTRKILQPENVNVWPCPFCFPKQAPVQMSASPQKCYISWGPCKRKLLSWSSVLKVPTSPTNSKKWFFFSSCFQNAVVVFLKMMPFSGRKRRKRKQA